MTRSPSASALAGVIPGTRHSAICQVDSHSPGLSLSGRDTACQDDGPDPMLMTGR